MRIEQYNQVTGLGSGNLFIMTRPAEGDTVGISAQAIANTLQPLSIQPRNMSLEDQLNNDSYIELRTTKHAAYEHANRNFWTGFTQKLRTGTGVFTMVRAGAGLTTYQNPGILDAPLDKALRAYGKNSKTYFPDISYFISGNAVTVSDDKYFWFNSVWHKITGAGGCVDYRSYFGPGGGDAHVPVKSVDLYYVGGPNAGGFSVFTGVWNTSNPPWTFVTGINATFGSSGCRRYSLTGVTSDYIQFRVSGSGAVTDLRVLTTDFISPTGRCQRRYYENNTSSIHMIVPDSGLRDQIRGTVFSGWNPDVMFFQFIGTSDTSSPISSITPYTTTGLNALCNYMKTNFPACHVVICGTYPQIADGNNTEFYLKVENSGQRLIALKYGYSYFDGYTPFQNFATWSGRGFSIADGVHHTMSGADAYRRVFDSWFDVLSYTT